MFKRSEHGLHCDLEVDAEQLDRVLDHLSDSALVFGAADPLELREVFMNLQTTLNDAETKAREAADAARKASSYAALWLFISLLAGAFTASWMATFGGKQRDL